MNWERATLIIGCLIVLAIVGVIGKLLLDGSGSGDACPYCSAPLGRSVRICPSCHKALGKR
jgi:hypothetical protein